MGSIRFQTADFQKRNQDLEELMYSFLGSIRRTSFLQDRIPKLDEQMTGYFKAQGDEFYQYLNKKFSDNEQALKMLDFLTSDLRYVKAKYLKFYEKYGDTMSEVTWRSFPKEFNEFSREMMARLRIEKEYLFPLLDQLQVQE